MDEISDEMLDEILLRRRVHKCPVSELQYRMYSYINSSIFNYVKSVYLYNGFAILYHDGNLLDELACIKTCDHRKMTTLHDYLAFVFRCKVENDEINKELFEPTHDEIKKYFEQIYIDTLFLDYSDPEYWYLAKKWHEFALKTLGDNKLIVRYIGEAVLLFTQPEYERQLSWDASYKAGDVVKNIFSNLPWEKYRSVS